jgi:drug/metabolite transporter (DMT)-like permease
MMLYALLAINISLMAIGQICFKKSSVFIETNPQLPILLRYVYNLWFYIGISAFGIATIIWIKVLSLAKLSSVYPMQSFAYIIVAILAYFVFGEKINAYNIIGITLIIAGIFFVSQGK